MTEQDVFRQTDWSLIIQIFRNKIIAKVKSRYHKRTHKFGFEVPKTVADALRLDKEHGDD